jgi:CRISPR-associated protein Cas1
MGTLFIDRRECRIALDGVVLELRMPGTPVRRIPAALLDRVVLRSDTLLNSHVLTGLAAMGVGILATGGRRGDRVAQIVGAPHKDVRRRITQVRRLDDLGFRLGWCRRVVAAKLKSQRRLLQKAQDLRPDLRKSLFDALRTVDLTRKNLLCCETIDAMRGCEGAAAAAFFGGYQTLFPESMGFIGRRRRPPTDPVNACLSLGYTLLYGMAIEACHVGGLDSMIGYLHAPCHGRASLASDIMEPLRAQVDAQVWELFRTRQLGAEHFGREGSGACLLGKAGRSRFYASWATSASRLRHALRRNARVAGRALGDLASECDEAEQE